MESVKKSIAKKKLKKTDLDRESLNSTIEEGMEMNSYKVPSDIEEASENIGSGKSSESNMSDDIEYKAQSKKLESGGRLSDTDSESIIKKARKSALKKNIKRILK